MKNITKSFYSHCKFVREMYWQKMPHRKAHIFNQALKKDYCTCAVVENAVSGNEKLEAV